MNRGFRLGQIVSGSLFSLSHGTNDAQKTMGIIMLALVASGHLPTDRFEAALAVVATVVFVGLVAFGIQVMVTK